MNNGLFTNHIALTSSHDISAICEPLKHLGITYFSYTNAFPDGTHFRLSNHHQWTQYYYQHEMYNIGFTRAIELLPMGCILWTSREGNPLFVESSKYFDIDNGISLVSTTKKCIEIATFAARSASDGILDFYINNISLLKRFLFYFKDIAQPIITAASKKSNRIYIPTKNEIENLTNSSVQPLLLDNEKRNAFINETKIKKYYVDLFENTVVLSHAEIRCLSKFAKGMTAKEISLKLCLSKRTVETHLENIKLKFGFNSKSELINTIIESGFDQDLI